MANLSGCNPATLRAAIRCLTHSRVQSSTSLCATIEILMIPQRYPVTIRCAIIGIYYFLDTCACMQCRNPCHLNRNEGDPPRTTGSVGIADVPRFQANKAPWLAHTHVLTSHIVNALFLCNFPNSLQHRPHVSSKRMTSRCPPADACRTLEAHHHLSRMQADSTVIISNGAD